MAEKSAEQVPYSKVTVLTHTLTHTGIAPGGRISTEWTATSGFSVKKGKNPYCPNGKYRF